MTPNKVKNNIYTALLRTKTISEGVGILDRFTNQDVREFIDVIYASLPKTLDVVANTINFTVVDAIPEHIREEAIDKQIKGLLRFYLADKIEKHQLANLICLLAVTFKQKFPTESITEEVEKVVEFYSSYIIPNSDELQSEVEYNPTTAQSQILGNYYIRVDEEGKLIPTRQTIEKFNHYLFNI